MKECRDRKTEIEREIHTTADRDIESQYSYMEHETGQAHPIHYFCHTIIIFFDASYALLCEDLEKAAGTN